MANELENTVREAALKLAAALKNASELQVTTQFVVVGADGSVNFEAAKPVAKTTIQLDGDTELIIPMTSSAEGTLSLDESLLDLHLRNVSSAVQYRASLLDALMTVVRQARAR